ncbi:MAG TPA: SH3 domain-containing protein [Pirellulales bacterium]|nr:SH3 domain-containing protein [Pirellulales bacterium]
MLLVASQVAEANVRRGRGAALRLAIAVWLAGWVSVAFAQEFPYTAYVNAGDVYLRSGPGENYYPVAKLERGQEVAVYRHDPGGWYAIRPPADCFSWVAAEFIEPRQGNLGVVIGDRVVARVGSSFSDTRDVIQVRLDRGEEVEILEAHEFNSGPAAQTWYKITPPAGEFRWISGRYLDRELAEPESREPSPDHNLLIARQNRHRSRKANDRESLRPRKTDPDEDDLDDDWEEADDDRVRQAVHEEPPPKAKGKTSKRPPQPLPEPEDDEDQELNNEEERPLRLKPEERRPKANLKEEAADLDLALSAMVSQEPTEWDFSLLRKQAERALDRADTALDRGRIRRVLRKIENFADIQQRHLAVMDVRVPSRDAVAVADRGKPAAGLSPLRYDGIGRLTQLTAVDPRVPQFALLDARGKVAAYVSPAPGVNLRLYLNREVGINGTLGYLPERQAQHLTAKRIVPVDNGMLR